MEHGPHDFYLPRTPDAVGIEHGPGSGRLSRHLVGLVEHDTVVRYPPVVTTGFTALIGDRGPRDIQSI